MKYYFILPVWNIYYKRNTTYEINKYNKIMNIHILALINVVYIYKYIYIYYIHTSHIL